MCWISRNELTKLIANKDIECYKNFRFEDITFKQKSIFSDFCCDLQDYYIGSCNHMQREDAKDVCFKLVEE